MCELLVAGPLTLLARRVVDALTVEWDDADVPASQARLTEHSKAAWEAIQPQVAIYRGRAEERRPEEDYDPCPSCPS